MKQEQQQVDVIRLLKIIGTKEYDIDICREKIQQLEEKVNVLSGTIEDLSKKEKK